MTDPTSSRDGAIREREREREREKVKRCGIATGHLPKSVHFNDEIGLQ
jgi:hypothetical protein